MTDRATPTNSEPAGHGHVDADTLVELALALGPDPVGSLRHLVACRRCSGSLEAVARVRAAEAPAEPDPRHAAELAEQVLQELGLGSTIGAPHPREPGPSWTRWTGLAGAGLAAALATFGTVLLLLSAGGFRPDGLLPALGAAALAALHPAAEETLARRRER